MKSSISRRRFFDKTIGISAGAILLPSLSGFGLQEKGKGIRPLIITRRGFLGKLQGFYIIPDEKRNYGSFRFPGVEACTSETFKGECSHVP